MDPAPESLPDDVAALKAALIAERSRGLEVAAELAIARAKASEDMALIAAQKLQIAKLQRQIYGQRSERSARLIDQLALEFEELSATATEDELAAEQAAANTTPVRALILREMMLDVVKDKLKMRSDEALERLASILKGRRPEYWLHQRVAPLRDQDRQGGGRPPLQPQRAARDIRLQRRVSPEDYRDDRRRDQGDQPALRRMDCGRTFGQSHLEIPGKRFARQLRRRDPGTNPQYQTGIGHGGR
jgi:Transposase C of IS166 homeodomain